MEHKQIDNVRPVVTRGDLIARNAEGRAVLVRTGEVIGDFLNEPSACGSFVKMVKMDEPRRDLI